MDYNLSETELGGFIITEHIVIVILIIIVSFICSCQTYEGGIAGEPGSEAHGGYVSCFS